MSTQSVKAVSELLNEEKWTRATLNSYGINNFQELDAVIADVVDDGSEEEVREICEEHLKHTKNSIIALYIAGILALRRQLVDDTNLVMIINIFTDNRKWNIVEYLCKRILEFGENKFALRTLADCYDNKNEDENKIEIWERLIKVDYEEADIVRQLAEFREEEKDIEGAIDYYKKAIHRYINKKMFTNIKDIWDKLVEYCPEETDFFFNVDKKIEKMISPERASQLLENLYGYYREAEDWDKSIDILKRILDYDPKNVWARKEITECYRQKFKDHSQLAEYIRISNLTQSWRNVHDAIADFEKHISFDSGNFVCHRSWGIGRIRAIDGDDITIDFTRKRGHSMSLKMAVNALSSLQRDHIWVLKVTKSKDELRSMVKEDPSWALRTIIRSFDNAANMKQIKAELVPSILTPSEWSSWSTNARKRLKEDTSFGNLPDKIDVFVVREQPISVEEKAFNRFKAVKSFFGKVAALRDFLGSAKPESEYFSEMFSYFVNILKAYASVNEQVVGSFLLVEHIVEDYPYLNPGLGITFKDLIEEIDDIMALFGKIEDSELAKRFLAELKALDEWPEYYVKIFPTSLSKYIIDELYAAGHDDLVQSLFSDIMEKYRENREAFIWLAKHYENDPRVAEYGIEYEKILINMIHLVDITFREITNRRDVSSNRKLNRQAQNFLFKEKRLENYLMKADEDSIHRLYTLVSDVKDLDPSISIELKHKIIERFPNFKFFGEPAPAASVGRVKIKGLIVTASSYQRKQDELRHIIDVEIPENSREIGTASALGDLRENAEYKAAKEKQELLNLNVSRLKDDLDKAQIFDKNQVDTEQVSFGTRVELLNNNTGKVETYAFFGPWESDPNKNVISYQSPFGMKLWGLKEGEHIDFSINENHYDYTVKSIAKGDF
ncbi:transcription elongation factor GreA [Marispirochaeta aestuarii]|uniref:transcription elongation factor GreA n=1 Tax=Marispirochaeta aestuarii TaxID=1963862 RepID=UPI0029C661D7|nr:transcription elongation factor GreA [Marispirochaeta aestuarii]